MGAKVIADLNKLSFTVIGTALRIHTKLGPGLMESVYQRVLFRNLVKQGLFVEINKPVGFEFEGDWFDDGLKVDLLVERSLVIELKSVRAIAPIHCKQLLTYVRLMDCKLGLLINFGELHLKDGIVRIANGL
jgi:iron complex transport system substrate-binding protein